MGNSSCCQSDGAKDVNNGISEIKVIKSPIHSGEFLFDESTIFSKQNQIKLNKGKLDKRSYKYLKLENGLKCLIVNDPFITHSFCTVNIMAGSALDPKDLPGLSQIVRCALDKGSEKYPQPNEFDTYLKSNGG